MSAKQRAKEVLDNVPHIQKIDDIDYFLLLDRIADMLRSVQFVAVDKCVGELKTTKKNQKDTLDRFVNRAIKNVESVKWNDV